MQPIAQQVVIIGGGFSGASLAVQLVRRSPAPLAITIVEPRPQVGLGLAYSTTDPDHRLNGAVGFHSIDPADETGFERWCHERGVFREDPEALRPSGAAFVRRRDYGRYLAEMVAAHARGVPTGSTITHLRDLAREAGPDGTRLQVTTASGRRLSADLVCIATGNPLPRLPRQFEPSLADHPGVVANPLDPAALSQVPRDARLLVVGSGLTTLDVLTTLLRDGHRGGIQVISRHGLRPSPQAPKLLAATPPQGPREPSLLERTSMPAPAFLDPARCAPTARAWLRAVRRHIAATVAGGGSWHEGFDRVRDGVNRLWPRLPEAEKRRFLRRLRTWYDVHRFRSPPQNDELVHFAEARGRVRFERARLLEAGPSPTGGDFAVTLSGADGTRREERFDAIVNCTGLDAGGLLAGNAFLQHLVATGQLVPHGTGIGFDVDDRCRAVSAEGVANPRLRVVGPPTAGAAGDPLGTGFIAVQIHRILGDLLATLEVEWRR